MATKQSSPRSKTVAKAAPQRRESAGPPQGRKPQGAALSRPGEPAAATQPFPIVGLGASAGGLEAFEEFFRHLGADSGLGFVLVQHLDPSHASVLAEILQRGTAMAVVEAQDQMPVLPNRVHVIPPNRDMGIYHGALQLHLPAQPRGQRMPIDAFLRSLAEDQGENAAGIILSGTGTDGTLGLRAIAGAGGLCLVQDPATAKYDGMPGSAIGAGYPVQVLPVEKMPAALKAGTRPLLRRDALSPPASAPAAGGGLGKVLMLLRTATGHDFALYKKSTIGRRIERRMAQHHIEDLDTYAKYLRQHADEVHALFRELLINVTSFFRDAQAFAVLKAEVLPGLLEGKSEEHPLRVWVAGCATGEEAYSLAIVLRELMIETQREFRVQLYATDLDDHAIATARAGLYPPNIAQDVSPERLRRFFVQEDSGYRVRKDVREMVVFAVQSVIKDPPFTRLDLLMCRNLMIYLEPQLQDRLLPALHYALKPGGVLLLSPSESIGSHTDLFEPIDRKWKLYRAKPGAASMRAVLGSGLNWTTGPASLPVPASGRQMREAHLAELARRALLQAFAPAAVVANRDGEIQYVHGDTGRFLRPAPGRPTHDLVEMAREGLQLELREALARACGQGLPTLNRAASVRTNGEFSPVALSVRLLPDPDGGQNLLLVSFQDLPATAAAKPARRPRAGSAAALRVESLQRELTHAKESLTAMLEEQQASNEELKSTNEELQSTNEELQSTNEELETSKEELQSVNEEMLTVNAELQVKIEQMAKMQDDMKNLLDNIRVSTIFLDGRLSIRRFTRDATQIYRLLDTDVGRPLADIRCELEGTDLIADAQTVLETLAPIEREVRTAAGAWYSARIRPYRTLDNVIGGVVMTFPEVTERLQAVAARKAQALAEAIVETVQHPLLVLDGGLAIVTANAAYYRDHGGSAQDTPGQSLFAVAGRRWDVAPVRELLEHALPRERGSERQVLSREFEGPGRRRLRLGVRRVAPRDGVVDLVLVSIETLDGAAPRAT